MDVVVVYDVAGTDTPEGTARQKRLADVCSSYGQRVQQSVFECRVSPVAFEQLLDEIRQTVDHRKDSVIIYRMVGDLRSNQTVVGVDIPHVLGESWVL